MKNFEKVLELKEKIESDYLQKEGIHGVSIGELISSGKYTGEFCIYLHVQSHLFSEGVLNEIEGVKIVTRHGEPSHPHADQKKYRPLKGGIQLQVKEGSGKAMGTLGCMAVDNESGDRVVLTNQHVIENKGKKIGQPKVCCGDEIGKTIRSVLSDNVDGAIGSIGNNLFEATILDIGDVNGAYTVTPQDILGGGYPVRKRGRTSGLTNGKITYLNCSGTRSDGWYFKNQLFINSDFGTSGDSGSVIVNDNNEVVGLYWGGSDTHGCGSPIVEVTSELNINILDITEAPAFASDKQLVLDAQKLYAQIEKETLRYPLGSYLYNQATIFYGEVINMVNTNKKVATVWHRNNGPAILNQLVKCAQLPNKKAADILKDQGGLNSIKAIAEIVKQHGSDELKTAIDKVEPYVLRLLEMTYNEILEYIRDHKLPLEKEATIPAIQTTTSDPAIISIDESSLNYISNKFFLGNPDYFNIEKVVPFEISEKKYEYLIELIIEESPLLELSPLTVDEITAIGINNIGIPMAERQQYLNQINPEAAENNLKAYLKNGELSIYNYEEGKKGKLIGKLNIGIDIVGSIGVFGSNLQILAIDGNITADSHPAPIADLLLQVVLDVVKDRFDDYPLPHPELFLGFSANIDQAEIEGKKLNSYVTISKDLRTINLDKGKLLKIFDEDNKATVSVSIPENTLSFIAQNAINIPNFEESAVASGSGFGVRVGVFAGISNPRIIIDDFVATANVELGAKAYVGVQAFGKWFDITLTPGLINLNLMVQLKAIDEGKTVALKFIPSFDTITIDWGLKLPFPFNIATSTIQRLLGELTKLLIKALHGEFLGIEIPLYTIADSYTIMNTDLNISFDSFGFMNKKAKALVSAK